jgi:hypothetical protein
MVVKLGLLYSLRKNRVLRNVFGAKKKPQEYVGENCLKRRSINSHFITYYMGDKSSVTRWRGNMARMEDYINACRFFLGKSL